MNGEETLRSFSEGGLRATESSAFVSGCPARERGELHFPIPLNPPSKGARASSPGPLPFFISALISSNN